MSVTIEGFDAASTHAEVLGPGADWVGAEHQEPDAYVLALSIDQVAAFEGTLPELRALAARIVKAVSAAEAADDVDDPDAAESVRGERS